MTVDNLRAKHHGCGGSAEGGGILLGRFFYEAAIGVVFLVVGIFGIR